MLVQREIADRLTAAPGDAALRRRRACSARSRSSRPAATRSRAASSCPCRTSTRRWSRSRAGPSWAELAGDWPPIVATVRAAFAHRRKTLANALALAGWRARPRRGRARRCAAAGIDPRRARRGARRPTAFALLRPRGRPRDVIAGAKINLCLRVGPRRADGYHELATVIAALDVGDDVELEPAAGDAGRGARPRRAATRS